VHSPVAENVGDTPVVEFAIEEESSRRRLSAWPDLVMAAPAAGAVPSVGGGGVIVNDTLAGTGPLESLGILSVQGAVAREVSAVA
jgi:hypothetical protein